MQKNNDGWGNLGNGEENNAAVETDNNRAGSSSGVDLSAFLSIMGSQSIMASNNGILEMKDIKKNIEEVLKSQSSTAAAESIRSTIPTMMDMSPDQSPHLPGIILYTEINQQVFLMPCLFFKKDIAQDALETINLGNNTAPQTYHKFAEAFFTQELRQKVKDAFNTLKGKQMKQVFIISNKVVDVDMYIQSAKDSDNAIISIGDDVLSEWYNAINNFGMMAVASTDPSKMPTVFRDGHLLGKDDTAVARIDTVQHPLMMDGHPVPFNLQVKLATAPKNNIYSQNYSNVKAVATTFLNVSLEVMSQEMYRRSLINNPMGIGTGPLVPVISLGKTIPGEQLNNNHSVMADMLGIFIQLSANSQVFFSEAFRQHEVGARGNISNLAQIAYQISGRQPQNSDILTPKSLQNQSLVMKFIQNYVSQRAVFVMDLANYTDRPSNNEFWWNLLTHKNGINSSYYKAFLMMLDKLSAGNFSKLSRSAIENNREKTFWKPGDSILEQTSVIIPVGTAKGKNGYFSLEEVDQMLLRDPIHYANNEQAIAQYVGLQNGSSGKDLRVRQYEMKKALEFLFSGNVSVVGWKSRWRFNDKFLNSFAEAMKGAGSITVTSNSATHNWEQQISNDYLMAVSTAMIQNTNGAAVGVGGVFSGWN